LFRELDCHALWFTCSGFHVVLALQGILVRSGGGYGTLGCTYSSPTVFGNLNQKDTIKGNLAPITGYSHDDFYGTAFVVYTKVNDTLFSSTASLEISRLVLCAVCFIY